MLSCVEKKFIKLPHNSLSAIMEMALLTGPYYRMDSAVNKKYRLLRASLRTRRQSRPTVKKKEMLSNL